MTDFRIGDAVFCVDNRGAQELEVGKVYTVTAYLPGSLGPRTHIRIEGGNADRGFGYYSSRFQLFGTSPDSISPPAPYAWARREIDL